MLYDNYLKKVKKLASILQTIRRHRVLILVVISIALASLTAYLAVQGTVYDTVACTPEIYYGESIAYEAKAVFGEVKYEYASAQSPTAWSENEPIAPGKYLIRAVSTSSFNTPKYGTTHEYTINPKDITVNVVETEILYGNIATVTAEMAYNDAIFCDGFLYEDISLQNTNIQAIAERIVITNENGDDVKDRYNITVASKPITILPHNITVTIQDATQDYNGLPLTNHGYEISDGELVEGNTLYATIDSSLTNAGITDNIVSSWLVVDADNTNVTAHYVINEIKGTLTVNKRPIYIETHGGSFVYDGTTHSVTDHKVIENAGFYPLVDEHTISPLEGYPKLTDVGVKENIIRFSIADKDGEDVTANYSIYLSETKSIEVTARPITLTTDGLTALYDDKYHYNDKYTIGGDGLAEGQTPSYSKRIEIIDVGEIENRVTMRILASGKDVTSNYTITYSYGTLTIEPIILVVQTEPGTQIYDGTPLAVGRYKILNRDEMVPGHADSLASSVQLTNVVCNADGDISGVANKVELKITGSTQTGGISKLSLSTVNNTVERDVSKNYVITYGENDEYAGILEILPRKIAVKTHSASFTYDGTSHQFLNPTPSGEEEQGFEIIDGTLADGESIRVIAEESASVTHVKDGVIDNKLVFEFIDDDGNVVPKENYQITCTPANTGKINIVPFEFAVTTHSASFIYNGNNQSYYQEGEGFELDRELPEGHTVSVSEYTSVLDINDKDVENKIVLCLIYGTITVDEDDYNIIYNYVGKLSINQRSLTIVADSSEKIYDATPLSCNGYTVDDDPNNPYDGLCASHSIEKVTLTGQRINVNEDVGITTPNIASDAIILSEDNKNVTENYDIIYIDGELTILQRPLLVQTATNTWVYNAEEHSDKGCKDISQGKDSGLVSGHSLVAPDLVPSRINVGETKNEFEIRIVDSEEVDQTDNYLVKYDHGTLTISKRNITVTANSSEKIYDGTALSDTGYTYTKADADNLDTGLISSHIIKVEVKGERTNVIEGTSLTTINKVFEVKIFSGEDDVTENYNITKLDGELKINPRPILVQTGSCTWPYNGGEHFNSECMDISEDENSGLLTGHSLVAPEKIPSIIDFGTKKNDFEVTIRDQLDIDKTSNYEILYEHGTLEITPINITINTTDKNWIYDGSIHTGEEAGYQVVITDIDNNILGVDLDAYLSDAAEAKIVKSNHVQNVYDGKREHVIDLSICLKQSGENVDTANYSVKMGDFGYLSISQRPILIVTATTDWTYDNDPHSDASFWLTDETGYYGLVDTHELEVINPKNVPTVTNVWDDSPENNVFSVQIKGDNKLTENYRIDYKYGTISILQRKITVTTKNGTWMYDGETHYSQELGEKEGSYFVGGDGLCSNIETKISKTSNVTNVYQGEIINEIEVKIYIKGTENEVDERNCIVSEYRCIGVLKITPRPLRVKTASDEWTYDGEPHSNNRFELSPATNLYYLPVLDHKVILAEPQEYLSVTNFWETEGVIRNNVFKVKIDGNELLNQNYTIDYIYGTLKINKRPICVVTATDKWVYDGQAHGNSKVTYTVVKDGDEYIYYPLLENLGHSLKVTNEVTITNAWETAWGNNMLEVIVAPEDKIDGIHSVNDNYHITYEYGTLTIDRRPILVETGGGEWTYDGKEHGNNDEFSLVIVESSDGYEYYPLLEDLGHSLKLGTEYYVTDAGIWNNMMSVIVIPEDKIDGFYTVNDNYYIEYRRGILIINPKPITITTGSNEKTYDGTPLVDGRYEVEGLLENLNHSIKLTPGGSQLEVGWSYNFVDESDIIITDPNGNKVTGNYTFIFDEGILTVNPIGIAVQLDSKNWKYDGNSHSAPTGKVISGQLLAGHKVAPVNPNEVPSVTEIGIYDNWFEIKIVDKNGNNVTSYYGIERVISGILTISEDEPEEDRDPDENEGGELDLSGNIGGFGDQNSSDGPAGEPPLIMQVKSTKSGSLYMRLMSYGNFNGKKWGEAAEYNKALNGKYSYNYLTGINLTLLRYEEIFLEVDNKSSQYFLPYYLSMVEGDYFIPSSDVAYTDTHGGIYTLTYYQYSGTGVGLAQNLGSYSSIEADYWRFVKDNYLSVDKDSQKFMDKIIATEKFDKNDPDIIQKVATYIQNAAKYNLEYNAKLDQEENIVIAFLETYKEGICSHYASAATLLYRSLGIPARYTVGFAGETVAGEWTEIRSNQAHAWVEVYVKGAGWIMVEVTGSGEGDADGGNGSDGGNSGGENDGENGSGNDDGNDSNDKDPYKQTITIYPVSLVIEGKPGTVLEAENKLIESELDIRTLLEQGYKYTVTVTGRQVGPGSSPCTITSFRLFDSKGNDVTDQFEIIYKEGTLTITSLKLIKITVHSVVHVYDGNRCEFAPNAYSNIDGINLDEYNFELSIRGGLTNAGSLQMDEIQYDLKITRKSDGQDVTNEYYIEFVGDLLTVKRSKIILIAASESKPYDGEPLENSEVLISQGSLVKGHKLVASAIGSITEPGTESNIIVRNSIVVTDKNGNIVTDNYTFECLEGKLTITDEE